MQIDHLSDEHVQWVACLSRLRDPQILNPAPQD